MYFYLKRQLGQLGTTITIAYDATASTESEVKRSNFLLAEKKLSKVVQVVFNNKKGCAEKKLFKFSASRVWRCNVQVVFKIKKMLSLKIKEVVVKE